ncbi:MAG TPA: cytochrome c biogenesis protein DipZ [Actinomycetota bacterium]|nr:cytochrome c biogenesis protein DipZ [Actinomycetota bacterium]
MAASVMEEGALIYLLAVAFVGGAASALTPCVLPILPALLAVSGSGDRRRVVGVIAGLELSFFLVGIVLAGILTTLGLPDELLQWVAAALLVAFALTMLVPALHRRFQSGIGRLVAPLAGGTRRGGFLGGVVAGAPLGLVWAPCAGPILAGITVAGATGTYDARTVTTMVAYGLGMLGPLLLIGFGGRRIGTFLRAKLGGGRRVEIGMGVVLLATAAFVATGWTNSINRFLAETVNLTSTPTAGLERDALTDGIFAAGAGGRIRLSRAELEASGYPELEELADYGRAPELAGISHWFNTEEELSLDALRGKVVLVDFWTYSCINCIRTFPYLREWYSKYEDDGFVILGVHTPEFAFERDPSNVGEAIDDFGIEYPVALDPDYATWDRFYNRYWPAHYLIDRDGILRSVHYGEGAYDRTENEIRHLLSLRGSVPEAEDDFGSPRTPETYLGYARADRFAGDPVLLPGESAEYEPPGDLPVNWWTYDGTWTVGAESAEAGPGAAIELHYLASDVHVVVGPPPGGSGTMTIVDGDGEPRRIEVDRHRLYTVRSGDHRTGLLRLELSEGVEVYSFTFG